MNIDKLVCRESYVMKVEPGKYSWCSCGYSEKLPICDGAHKTADTEKRSIKEEVTETKEIVFCGCKQTKMPPFCDGTQGTN